MNVSGTSGNYRAETVPPDCRALSRDLRAKVINEPASERRAASLRAGVALQMMSDRNFGQAPQLIKQQCRTALDECTRAWADHGAHEKG